MRAPFTHELGVFDPTFPGITLHFPNEATWKKVREVDALYYRLAATDMLKKNPVMSPKDVDPTRVMQYIFESVDNGISLSPEEKDAIGREFIAHDHDNAVANLAIASAFEHERRHFHDWLLSPYTAAITAIRAEVFMNYVGLRQALRAGGTTIIPVPLPRWLQKSEAEQKALLDMWQSLLGDSVPIQLPDLTQPGVAEVIEAISQRYRSIGALFDPVAGTNLDAASIFEASALLIQTQAINELFGETASSLFIGTMAELGSRSRYGWFLQTMNGLRRPGEILENNTLSAIATWCLLGNNTADTANAHPLIRFGHAVRCVEARGFSKLDKPTVDILDELDRSSGVMPYRELLEHSIDLGETIVQMFENMIADDRSGSNFPLGIAQAQEFLHRCHVYMGRLLMDDPDSYCQPAAYLNRSLEKLPEPPLRQTFGRPFYSVKRSMLDRFEHITLFEEESTADEAFLRQTIIQLPKGVVDLQLADNWQYLCGMVDTVFADYNRDHPAIDAQKALAKKSGLRYLDIFL
jgi:hypothetical protein